MRFFTSRVLEGYRARTLAVRPRASETVSIRIVVVFPAPLAPENNDLPLLYLEGDLVDSGVMRVPFCKSFKP